jgi:cytochrome c oxidase subunit III
MEIPYTVKTRPDTGLYNAKVGIWLFLASEVMLFGALFSGYILLRVGAPQGDWGPANISAWPHHLLNIWLGMTNTLVLICSSVTVVLAWASLKMNQWGRYKFFQGITIACALIFMVIKTIEYRDKFTHYYVKYTENGETKYATGHIEGSPAFWSVTTRGNTLTDKKVSEIKFHPDPAPAAHGAAHGEAHGEHATITIKSEDVKELQCYGPWLNTYLAIYFCLTALHGLHVMAGAFVIFMIWGPLAKMWKTDPERYTNRIEVSGLFWHFVDLVWIFLFPVFYLL